MGLSSAAFFPCIHQLSGSWYPLQERSRLVAFVGGGPDLGAIIAIVVSPALMTTHLGWPIVYELLAVLSFVWVFIFAVYGSDSPTRDRRITVKEREFILANQSPGGVVETNIAWKMLLTNRRVWAICLTHFCEAYAWTMFIAWVPRYIREEVHVDLSKQGFIAAVPYIGGWCGMVLFGRLGDILLAQGYSTLQVRQICNTVGFVSAAVFLFSLRFVSTIAPVVGLLSLALFCLRGSHAGFWVNMIDIAPHHVAHVMGLSNTMANLTGVIGNVITGYILEVSDSWNTVFGITSGLLLFGAIFFYCNASGEPIYDATEPDSSWIGVREYQDSCHQSEQRFMKFNAQLDKV